MAELNGEGFQVAESHRRESFDHKINFDPKITNPSTIDRIREEIKVFNGDGSGAKKIIFSITDDDSGVKTLQIWEKSSDPGQSNHHVMEIDLFGGSNKQIRTNDIQKSKDALEKFQSESFTQSEKLKILKNVLGSSLRKTLSDEIRNEANRTLPVAVAEVKTKAPGIPDIDEKFYPKEQTAIVPIRRTPIRDEDPGKAIELVKEPAETRPNPNDPTEVVLVPPTPVKNEIVRVSDHERTDQPKKAKKEIHFGVAAAVGGHETTMTFRNAYNKEITRTVKSREVLTQASERFASMQMSETAAKREEGFLPTVKTYLDRFWRGTLTKGIHEKKEKFHGMELMAAAGVETGITAEFNAEIDRRAREKIEKERAAKTGGKFFGALRDFGNEFIGRERDLHREKVLITTELRALYMSNPSDESNPLVALLRRDTEVREALAENIMTSPVDFLHAGDKKTAEFKVDSDSIFGKFLREEILLKIKDDVVTRSKLPNYDGKIEAKLRVELDQNIQDFLFSDKFQEYRKTLSVEDQKRFENSLTYATNILSQAESSFIPLIKENADFMTTAAAADMDIWLTLGTAQLGPKGEIKAPSVFDKDRISNNQALFDRLREVRRNSKRQNAAGLYDDAELRKGEKRDLILAATHSVATSEILAATVGALGGRFLMTAARGSISWIPLGSAGVTGLVSGVKEFNASTELRGQWLVEGAEGYDHPSGANATRAEAMKRFDYYRIDLGHRIQQLDFSIGELQKGNPPTEAQILQTIAYMADSQARISLGDKNGYSLFTASKDTAEERGIFQAQETIHNKARVLALNKLQTLLDGDANKDLRAKIATAMGADPTQMTDSMNLIHTLATSQELHLKTGTKVSSAFMAVMGRDEKLIIKEEQSIDARDEAFNKYRWMRGFSHGVVSGSIAGLFALGASHYQDLHFDTIKKGFTEGPIKLLDHTLPTHPTGLPDGSNAILDPQTGELVGATYTHIPTGAHWVEDATHDHAFDLVLDKGDVQKTLINDATFSHDGHMNLTSSVIEDMKHNHLVPRFEPQEPIDWVSTDTMSAHGGAMGWDNVIKYKDLPGGSLDAYFNQNLHESFAANPPLGADGQPLEAIPYNGATNALRYLTRSIELHKYADHSNVQFSDGIEHNLHTVSTIHGTEFISAPQTEVLELTKMPDYLVGPEGNRNVANLVIEAIHQHDAGQNFSDEAHRIAWEISQKATEADVPTASELDIINQYLEQSATTSATPAVDQLIPYDTWITASQDLVVQGQVADEALINHTVWNPASLVIPAGGYFHPLEAVETKKAGAPRQAPNPTPQSPSQPTPPGPIGSQPTLPPPLGTQQIVRSPQNREPVLDNENNSDLPSANPELEINETPARLELKDFQTEIGADIDAQLAENANEIVNNPTGTESKKVINKIMSNIADKHKLPIAFLIKDNTVKVLTRPPEVMSDLESKVYYFNAQTGKEDVEIIKTDKNPRGDSTIYMSDFSNFPPGASDKHNGAFYDYTLAAEYFRDIKYDFSNFETEPDKALKDGSTVQWLSAIPTSLAFVMAARAAQSSTPSAPEKPEEPPVSGESDAPSAKKKVEGGIGTELPQVFAEGGNSGNESKIIEIMHDQAYNSFIPALRAELAPLHQDREDWQKMPEKAWVTDKDIIDVANKYDIPIAFMRRHMYNGPHFIVLVEPPKKMENGDYTIRYYDPKADGIHSEVVNLDRRPDEYAEIFRSNAAISGEVGNDTPIGEDAMHLLQNADYNLEIDERLQPWKNAVEAKSQVGPNQEGDGDNCGPLILLYAARARALKVDKKGALAKAKIRAFDKFYGIETPISQYSPI